MTIGTVSNDAKPTNTRYLCGMHKNGSVFPVAVKTDGVMMVSSTVPQLPADYIVITGVYML